MKQVFSKYNSDGWTYYIDCGFAWFPMYCQGTLIWLRRYWMTWPEKKDGSLVMASDVLSAEDMKSMNNNDQEMYRAYYPYDPRQRSDE